MTIPEEWKPITDEDARARPGANAASAMRTLELFEPGCQMACGLALDHGRLLEEAAEMWDADHLAKSSWTGVAGTPWAACAACEDGLVEQCPLNPYRQPPRP